FAIVMAITWLLLMGVRESATANNVMVTIKLLVLALFIIVGLTHIDTANYHPFAPNGFRGIHQGAAIVFFAYIGFDCISTAAEEHANTRVPHITTLITGIFVALWALIGDAGETYNLTNIGTLFAFALVSIGVLVLRKTDPLRPRPFRVKWILLVAPLSAILC